MPAPLLLVITTLRTGGAERIVADLALGLDPAAWAPVVAALDGRGEVAERIRAGGREVVDLGAYASWRLDGVLRLRSLVRRLRPALVHAHMIHAAAASRWAAGRLGIPVLSTCHIVERRFRPWHAWWNRWTARWGRMETCVSATALRAQAAATGLPAAFFRVVPNGIDLGGAATAPGRDAARTALGLDSGRIWIGGLGRFDRQKGWDLLLRALAEPALADCSLALAGEGREEGALRALAANLGLGDRIRFCGRQDGPWRFLPACDIVAVPSRWEGFGLVLAEAMACGIPVVASEDEALREVGAEAVLYAPRENPQALARELARLVGSADLRARLAEAGRARAGRFSRERMLAGYAEAYAACLGPTGAP